jgi:hypothetical protein|tara:strand:+ start:795 stop:1478 length:684 start_codon:yes stop_codon:yes gene_type:complete
MKPNKKIIDNKNRYERKWVFKNINYLQVFNLLIRSKFYFKKHYPLRKINSIYYDDHNLSCIKHNLDGVSERVKYRVRWYGEDKFLNNPNFEIKMKKGFEVAKKLFPLKNFNNCSANNNFNELTSYINKEIMPSKNLLPTVIIKYERIYLVSSDNLIRATIDYQVKSKKIFNFRNNFFVNFSDVILELKYDPNLDWIVRKNFDSFNVRLSKNSKYINCSLNRYQYLSA